jgi:hypothetical protein
MPGALQRLDGEYSAAERDIQSAIRKTAPPVLPDKSLGFSRDRGLNQHNCA